MISMLIAILFLLMVADLTNLPSSFMIILQAFLAVAAIYVNINYRPREISEKQYQTLASEAKTFPRSKRFSYPMVPIPLVDKENPWSGYVEKVDMYGKTYFRIMIQKEKGIYADYFLPEENVIFEPTDHAPREEIHWAVTLMFGNVLLSIIPQFVKINIYLLRIPK